LEEREGRRVEEVWFQHARLKTAAFWGPLSPQKPNTMAFWGPLSPHKTENGAVLGTTFIPKAQHDAVLIKLTSFSPNFPCGPAHYFFLSLSFMVSVDKWVWVFFTTSDINMVNI
jgi:hypothetical protein